jgi:hypothetical protein
VRDPNHNPREQVFVLIAAEKHTESTFAILPKEE